MPVAIVNLPSTGFPRLPMSEHYTTQIHLEARYIQQNNAMVMGREYTKQFSHINDTTNNFLNPTDTPTDQATNGSLIYLCLWARASILW